MKIRLRFTGAGFAVLVLLLLAPVAWSQQIEISNSNRTLAITATGMAHAIADTATVHVGYVTYGPNADEAYAKGSKLSSAIITALKNAGVQEDAIESASQNLTETPQYELEKLPPAEQAQRRFQLNQSWTVKTAAKDAASVLNAAVNAGANRSGAIDWSVKDENGLEAQAAAKALARAHAIAAQMAKGLGIQLGALLYAAISLPSTRRVRWPFARWPLLLRRKRKQSRWSYARKK